jgi:hypothetical protein
MPKQSTGFAFSHRAHTLSEYPSLIFVVIEISTNPFQQSPQFVLERLWDGFMSIEKGTLLA